MPELPGMWNTKNQFLHSKSSQGNGAADPHEQDNFSLLGNEYDCDWMSIVDRCG